MTVELSLTYEVNGDGVVAPVKPVEPGTRTEASVATLSTATISAPAVRRRLPDTRQSITHKFSVAGHEGYLSVGLFDDGSPGELFVKMSKAGSTVAGWANTVGILTSMCLQHGVPVSKFAEKLSHTKFEPAGHTTNPDPDLAEASSVVDYIFRWLEFMFGDRPAGQQPNETA